MSARASSSVLPILSALLLLATSAGAFPAPDPPTRYELAPAASYEEGCYGDCLCPVLWVPGFTGGFTLARLDDEEGWEVYEVEAVAWEMVFDGEVFRRALGAGSYRIHREERLQRMQLDLEVSDVETAPFDSGIVAVEAQWPAMDITIHQAKFFCFDYVFHVNAVPTGPVQTQEGPTWGTLKSIYRE